jgi:hypothetical protein
MSGERVLRFVRYLWASPTTLLGLLFVIPTLISRGRIRNVDGVLEIRGGITAWFLRYCTFLKGGALAMTLGHVVLGVSAQALDRTRRHERVHVRQCERWGPFFLPAYAIASLVALISGRSPYRDNYFERQAFEKSWKAR